MTEKEAKTKWCPFARSLDDGVNVANREWVNGRPIAECMCLASNCMAWRWSDEIDGYCGLANLPDFIK